MGHDFKDDFDAIIKIEEVTITDENEIILAKTVEASPGSWMMEKGNIVGEGTCLIEKGSLVNPEHLAALAFGGHGTIAVYEKPVVGFIPTGSELIPAGTVPKRGDTIDANSIMAEALIEKMGGKPLIYPIVKDDRGDLEVVLNDALTKSDIVIINGGSSKGKRDYNAKLLKEKGEVICHGLAAAPGKPLCLAVIEDKPVINLPGPTVAAFYGMNWCINAIMNTYLNKKSIGRKTVKAILTEDMMSPKGIDFLCKLQVTIDSEGNCYGRPLNFSNANSAEIIIANGYFTSPIGEGDFKKGAVIEIELLGPLKCLG